MLYRVGVRSVLSKLCQGESFMDPSCLNLLREGLVLPKGCLLEAENFSGLLFYLRCLQMGTYKVLNFAGISAF